MMDVFAIGQETEEKQVKDGISWLFQSAVEEWDIKQIFCIF